MQARLNRFLYFSALKCSNFCQKVNPQVLIGRRLHVFRCLMKNKAYKIISGYVVVNFFISGNVSFSFVSTSLVYNYT